MSMPLERMNPRHAAVFSCALALALLAPGSVLADGRVYPSAEAVRPLAPGASVPATQVETVLGAPVDLAEILRSRGALLVFYRGGW